MRKGFRPLALIPDYLPDPETRGWGVIIVWDNPTFDPKQPIGKTSISAKRYRFTPKPRSS
jgi:hypothetical protein